MLYDVFLYVWKCPYQESQIHPTIIIIIIIKISSTGQSGKNKIVYKLLTQTHKHQHHIKQKNKLIEATNDWLLP